MIIKNVIGLSALFLVGVSFCAEEEKELITIAEENSLSITPEKYPLLSRFTNFAEKFNACDIETKIQYLYLFYRDTQNYGGKDFRKRKALEVKSLLEAISYEQFPHQDFIVEDEDRITSMIESIEIKYPQNNLRIEIEDDYFDQV